MTTNMNSDLITIAVRFSADSPVHYTYMAGHSDNLEVGDFVVVKVANQYKVTKVVEIHDTPQLDGGHNYTWIVQKVDPTKYGERMEQLHQATPSVGARL